MELDHFISSIANYLPDGLNDNQFKDFLLDPTKVKAKEYSDLLMLTLPYPRMSHYEKSDYDVI